MHRCIHEMFLESPKCIRLLERTVMEPENRSWLQRFVDTIRKDWQRSKETTCLWMKEQV